MNALFMFVLLCVAQPDEDVNQCPASIQIQQKHILLKDCRKLQKPILQKSDSAMFPACVREVGEETK
jgi:hypothetical protein